MFDDLKGLIEKSELPSATKVVVIVKAITWLPVIFIAAGLLMSNSFFIYWLIFFVVAETAMLLALIRILVIIVRSDFAKSAEVKKSKKKENRSLLSSIKDGIVGNLAFYLFLLIIFIILKLYGVIDQALQALLLGLHI